MLGSHPFRLHSNSSPQRADSTAFIVTNPPSPDQMTSGQTSPRLGSREPPLNPLPPPTLSWAQGGKSKILRMKRPSSSGGVPWSQQSQLHSSHKFSLTGIPPRPPRNPARVRMGGRPSTSSGVLESTTSHTVPRLSMPNDVRRYELDSPGESTNWKHPFPVRHPSFLI